MNGDCDLPDDAAQCSQLQDALGDVPRPPLLQSTALRWAFIIAMWCHLLFWAAFLHVAQTRRPMNS